MRWLSSCLARRFSLLLLVFLASCSLLLLSACVRGADDVSLKVAEAEGKVKEAYAAVLEAESFGANVTNVVSGLNAVAVLLGDANVAFRLGDYGNASLLVDRCIGLADAVVAEAGNLKSEALARPNALLLAAGLSGAGLAVLFFVGLFGWRFVRSRYVRRVLKMKPEEAVSS